MATKTPPAPANIEAERALLGGILLSDGKLYPEVASMLTAEEFFLPSHRAIFSAMGEISGPIDLVTLCEAMGAKLFEVGGPVYLSSLTDGTPKLDNLEHYAHIVKQRHSLRGLAKIGDGIQRRALSGEQTPEDLSAQAQRALSEMQIQADGGFVSLEDIYREEFPTLDSIHQKWETVKGLPTGFDRLDSMTGGLHGGELTLLAARPSLGKTSLAVNMAVYIARAGNPVGIFSLEMSRDAILLRIVCGEARVSSQKLMAGYVTREQRTQLVEVGERVKVLPIWIDDQIQKVETMTARAKALKTRHGLALVVVDYIQLMSTGRHENRVQEISYISRAMKGMAKELRVPVLALSQLNRDLEDRAGCPRLSDLRDSGQLEQDADTVLFLWRPKARKNHPSREVDPAEDFTINLEIAKQRNGPIGLTKLVFLRDYCRFENAAEGY